MTEENWKNVEGSVEKNRSFLCWKNKTYLTVSLKRIYGNIDFYKEHFKLSNQYA